MSARGSRGRGRTSNQSGCGSSDPARIFYLYGLCDSDFGPLPSSLKGVGAGAPPVSLLPAGELSAIVSPADELGPDPTEENVMAHQAVMNGLMAQGTVIPFSFGTVLPERLVLQVMQTTRGECQKLLKLLNGKVEVGLKLLWKPEAFLPEIETREIAELRAQVGRGGRGRRPALEARLGEALLEAANRKRAEYLQTLYEPLAAHAVAARLSDIIGPRMILNGSFLIERSAEGEFDALVNRLCVPHLPRLDIRYTGPWPPYNFVTLRLQVEGGG